MKCIVIDGKNYRITEAKHGDRVVCLKSDTTLGHKTKVGDMGVVDLLYDRVYVDNGEEFIYVESQWGVIVRSLTDEELKRLQSLSNVLSN